MTLMQIPWICLNWFMAFEEAYNVEIPSEDLEKLETVGDVMDYIRDKEIDA